MEEKERFEILQEHMDIKFDVIIEGHQVLHKEIKQARKEARLLNQETNLKLDVIAQTLSGKIEQVDQKVEINRQEIVKNRKKIEEVDDKLSSGLKKYENHEDRIKVLEVIN